MILNLVALHLLKAAVAVDQVEHNRDPLVDREVAVATTLEVVLLEHLVKVRQVVMELAPHFIYQAAVVVHKQQAVLVQPIQVQVEMDFIL
jgi:hypothetical protein